VKERGEAKKEHEVAWRSVFSGKKPVEVEMSKWDRQELDSLRKELVQIRPSN